MGKESEERKANMNYRQTCGWTTTIRKQMSLYTFRVDSLNDHTVLSVFRSYICIHKESATTLFFFFFLYPLQAVFSVTERLSGRRQTAKVIIICGHAAPHLTDGDNLSQHFSIKKENTNKQKGKRKHTLFALTQRRTHKLEKRK